MGIWIADAESGNGGAGAIERLLVVCLLCGNLGEEVLGKGSAGVARFCSLLRSGLTSGVGEELVGGSRREKGRSLDLDLGSQRVGWCIR